MLAGWGPRDGGGGRRLKTSIQGEEMKLNSKVDDIRFKGRKNMGEARNTSRQSGHKNRDTGRMERMWKWPGLKRYALSSPAPGRAEDTASLAAGQG